MTLELTAEQLKDLRAAVDHYKVGIRGLAISHVRLNKHPDIIAASRDKTLRFEALDDLLKTSTAVILYQS